MYRYQKLSNLGGIVEDDTVDGAGDLDNRLSERTASA